MHTEHAVLMADDPRIGELQARGWQVIARSWGAQLNAADVNARQLGALVDSLRDSAVVRELELSDWAAIMTLDAATVGDYPGGVATVHMALDSQQATVTASRRGFGVISPGGGLVAMTFVDVNDTRVETDFTVVAKQWHRRGLASAVKAAAILALLADGAERFRTGGSEDNAASLAANTAVGYVIDEAWLTLAPPAP